MCPQLIWVSQFNISVSLYIFSASLLAFSISMSTIDISMPAFHISLLTFNINMPAFHNFSSVSHSFHQNYHTYFKYFLILVKTPNSIYVVIVFSSIWKCEMQVDRLNVVCHDLQWVLFLKFLMKMGDFCVLCSYRSINLVLLDVDFTGSSKIVQIKIEGQ